MATALVALATTTLASASATVTFAGIPGGYRDLRIVATLQTTSGPVDIAGRFNSDSGSNYSRVGMYGNGSTAGSFTNTSVAQFYWAYATSPVSNVFNSFVTDIMDYTATDKHKTLLSRADLAGDSTAAYANRWASTSAITSISLFPTSGSFAAGSTFSLYGIVS